MREMALPIISAIEESAADNRMTSILCLIVLLIFKHVRHDFFTDKQLTPFCLIFFLYFIARERIRFIRDT